MTKPKAADEPGTILLVDDEPEILTALTDLFEDEYRVLATNSPLEALEIVAREPALSVIVSDQRMPAMPGDVFLSRARELTRAEALLLTGYADLDAVVGALNQGGIAGYAPKPWNATALRAMVAHAYTRWRIGRELETERALLHGLLDNSTDAISFKDVDGHFVRLNKAKADAIGATVLTSLGQREGAFLADEDAAAIEKAEREVIETRQPAEIIEERRTSDGGTKWFQTSRVPILEPDGTVSHLVTMERDVTGHKLLEARLRQADKMQALGTLAGGIAHDFNNLLTAILGSLELAGRRAPDDPRLRRLLDGATLAAKRGAALTQRLLGFSRQRIPQAHVIDVNQVLREMNDLLMRTLGGIVRVERRLEMGLWPANVEPDQLELAVLNLCINARDAMPDGGVVVLSTRNVTMRRDAPEPGGPQSLPDGDYVMISVADSGMGMTADVLRRVFEPFFTTKEIGKGTGLGLSMVYALAEQCGGTAHIDSVPGEGTRVDIYLPRVISPGKPPQGEDRPEAAPIVGRVLVVDDDPEVRAVTSAFIADLGHGLAEANDGASALRALKSEQIDLVVADFAMPGMNGAELATQARISRPDLPVLLVTGYADLGRVPDGYPVLHKPFEQAELAAAIANLLRDARRTG